MEKIIRMLLRQLSAMSILVIPKISETIEQLLQKFNAARLDVAFIEECMPVVASVETWKYSRHQYFHPVPYESEISGYPRGKILKKTYANPYEGSAKGNFCFGFIGDFHAVTIAPSASIDDPKEISLYSMEGEVINLTHTVHFYRTAKPSQLQSIGKFFPMDGNSWVHVSVARERRFFVYLYQYNADRMITSVKAFSKSWGREIEYDFLYEESGQLSAIVSGGQVIWPKAERRGA